MISCQIGSPQLVAETQIPNLPTSVVEQTPVIGSSQVQIPNSVTDAPAFAGDQPVIVIDNVISSDGLIISSDNDSESISEHTSESINKVTSESINEYTSESINANTSESSKLISESSKLISYNISANLVSPGSSLDSAPFPGISGVAKTPYSSNSLSGAVRVSSVPSGLRVAKAAVAGVTKSSAARLWGLSPGLRKGVQEWAQIAGIANVDSLLQSPTWRQRSA